MKYCSTPFEMLLAAFPDLRILSDTLLRFVEHTELIYKQPTFMVK